MDEVPNSDSTSSAELDAKSLLGFYGCSNDAFDALYARHSARLKGYIRKHLPLDLPDQEPTAADIAHDVWLEVVASKSRPSTRWKPGGRPVMAWEGQLARR
ncbi:MAG: hypothetical protein HY329_24515 [Chloroflexi bacterium]|nr:hypothetical protein [Chloroflexota bacterium]